MLSVGKLTPGSDRYYEDVARGAEDYYAEQQTGEEDALGQWLGAGAGALGLEGTVEDGQLAELIARRDPLTGAPLRRGLPSGAWVREGRDGRPVSAGPTTGFDLTFSAPKSVSVLYGISDEDVRGRVRDAHDAAVRDALGYMERQAALTRRGDGTVRLRGVGLVAAAYRHVASRAGDPQLHTHVVTGNATLAEGRWSTLDGRAVYAHAKTGGYVYQASLRAHLGDRLGVRWGEVRNGVAEIDDIDRSVIDEFSRRRAEIVEAMALRGEHSARAAQAATLQTRRAKDYAITPTRLREEWRARASEHGLGRAEVAAVIDRPASDSRSETVAQLAALMAGPEGLTKRASAFTRRDVLQAWAGGLSQGATVAQIERLADAWLAGEEAVALEPGDAVAGDEQVAGGPLDLGARYSTPELLAAERALVASARARVGEAAGLASETAVQAALAARPSISDEQAAMVRALTSSGDGVQVVRGLAGTGKTFALDACREAWEATGVRVFGCSVAGKAAQGLADETGMPTSTIARLLMDLRDRHGLARGSVLVVDEAGMAGSRRLCELADHAQQADAKLVLVGDDGQLPELDAGGAFRALVARQGAVELSEVRRQHDPADVADLQRIREGHADQALDSWNARGRVVLGDSAEQTRELMVRDWWRGQEANVGSAVMLARRNCDVRDLNRRARETMRDHGRLGDRELAVDGRAFAVGDRVVAGQNARRLDVLNGTLGTVSAVGEDGLTLHTDGGTEIALPLDYVAGRRADGRPNLDHGYAISVHRAQGATFDRTYILGSEDTYREEAYTALSRHRDEGRLYLTAPDVGDRTRSETEAGGEVEALSQLKTTIGKSRAKTLALDIACDEIRRTATDEQLATEARQLRQVVAGYPRQTAVALDRLQDGAQRAAREYAQADTRLRQLQSDLSRTRGQERAQAERALTGARDARDTWRNRVEELAKVWRAVIAQGGDPDTWLHEHGAHVTCLAAVEQELSNRERRRHDQAVRAVTVDPPRYVVAALGSRPGAPSRRAAWDRGARSIESYRQRHARDLAPEVPGLGPRPTRVTAARAWDTSARTLDTVSRHLGLERATPAPAPDLSLDR